MEKRMDNAAGHVSGCWLFSCRSPLCCTSARGAEPKGTDQVITATGTAFKVLHIAAGHWLSCTCRVADLLALGGLVVSYAAIAMLVRGRGWVIATVAALLGSVGAFSGALLNVLVG